MGGPFAFFMDNDSRHTRYFATALIGEGGFGQVWSGVTSDGLPVAIKLTKPTNNPMADFVAWYNEQDLYLQCLEHPNIVTTYDQFEFNGNFVIVMEKADGNLRDFVGSNAPIAPRIVRSVGLQLCAALEHIHALGVIHRDVTLQNVLRFENGVVKLSDFGISKQTVTANELARTLIAYPNAIPPELINAGYSSFQSDVYQLGLVLLSLLAGREPIPRNAPQAVTIQMIKDGVPRQIAESLVPVHGRLADVLSIMLRRHDYWRYQTIAQVRTDLETTATAR